MDANPQVTGHVILTCPACGYSVQIDEATLEKKVLVDGDKMTVGHAWSLDGALGIALTDQVSG